MECQILLTSKMARELKHHILSVRSREQMAVVLCGVNHIGEMTRLLGRHLVLLPSEAFQSQSAGYLDLKQEVQRFILKLAASEGLSQVDFHSHPGESPIIGFSWTDDINEAKLASYLAEKMENTHYGSVVMNTVATSGRIWERNGTRVVPKSLHSIRVVDFGYDGFNLVQARSNQPSPDQVYCRQVLAFGEEFQRKLSGLKVGLIGHGGLGSIFAKQLTRLGVGDWVVVDDDHIELSNHNRLPGTVPHDAERKLPKVSLAQRNIFRINPKARVIGFKLPVGHQKVLQSLKACDLLIVATDNHSSRLIANRLSVQYLIPLVHVGVNIDVGEDKTLTDISGEHVFPALGEWCLHCAGIIDTQLAGWELADEETRKNVRQRGYIKDTPSPSVYHLNSTIASLAVAEIHNFVFPYKPIKRYLSYDELNGELLALQVPPQKDCPVCGTEGGVIGLGDLEALPDYEGKRATVILPQSTSQAISNA